MTSQPCFLTAVIMTILAVVGDTRSNPTPQTWSALTKPSVTTIFSSFEQIYRANRKNHCQSWIHCKNSCTRWQQNDNSSGSQHWQVTMEQHSSKRLGSPRNLCQGRQEDEDSNPAFFPPSIYTVIYSYRQLPRFASTEHTTTLSIPISHQTLLFLWANPILHWSPQQHLHYPEVFKNFRSSFQAIIINFWLPVTLCSLRTISGEISEFYLLWNKASDSQLALPAWPSKQVPSAVLPCFIFLILGKRNEHKSKPNHFTGDRITLNKFYFWSLYHLSVASLQPYISVLHNTSCRKSRVQSKQQNQGFL